MPLLTKTEAKTLLQISDSTKDAIIDMLIPVIQSFILNHTQNTFDNRDRLFADTHAIVDPVILQFHDRLFRYHWVIAYGTQFSFTPNDGVTLAKIADSTNAFLANGFKAGMDIRVIDSMNNDGYYTIDSISAGEVSLISGQDVSTEVAQRTIFITKVVWPPALKIVASQMIRFHLDPKQGDGMASERIGDYSYSKLGSAGYPDSIMQGLKPFTRIKFI